MKQYNPKAIEAKWQTVWADTHIYAANDNDTTRPKSYYLVEFPYPSGDGLHVGHVLSYTALDIMARHKRMQGFNVLYPMGFDEFGLPTENYAIKHKIAPQLATDRNVATFRRQLKSLGLSFDWDREVRTADPAYYRWTQWIFLKLLEKGLAYQAEMAINWCPFEKTGLANEEVVDGKHERCGTPVEKKLLKQWMLKITAYADRLAQDLQTVDYLDRIASQQVNWIGRSEGAEITWQVEGLEDANPSVTVYTTRPDTLFGATFLVISPELANTWIKSGWQANAEAAAYIEAALAATELSRQEDAKQKTGVDTGLKAIHPLSGEPVPIWVADYVLGSYGTGAIMAVPAHDERDYAFAKGFELPIVEVVAPNFGKILPDAVDVTGSVVLGYDPATKQFMSLINNKNNMRWLASGGLEPGEDYRTAALRELKEEAGFANVSDIIQLGGPTFSYYFNTNKLSNRRSFSYMFLAIIDSTKQGKQAQELHESFRIEWSDLDTIVADFKKEPDGRGHWIDGMAHVKQAVDAYESGRTYRAPVFTGYGTLFNSGQFNGLEGAEAKRAIVQALADKGAGKTATKYRLRDWIFSRQHYWGEPIPVVHCAKDGVVPVPAAQLPVTLPVVDSYEPTDTGESPLAAISSWVNTTCPTCGGPAKRETDTMPNWAGSSWYYLRYMDARNDQAFASPENLKYWSQVDLYNGGMEHTTLHLLYSRFWHKFLFDEGLVPTSEPYARRRSHGMILGPDGQKMSKSKGNVINPDHVIERYGADTLRLYEMFMGPFDEVKSWSEDHLNGVSRFIYRTWTWLSEMSDDSFILPDSVGYTNDIGAFTVQTDRITHKTLKKVHHDIQQMHFNTAVSSLMELVNFLTSAKHKRLLMQDNADALKQRTVRTLVLMLAPFTPHLAEESWHEQLGEQGSVHVAAWPAYDPQLIKDDVVTVVVQVNGKHRANLAVANDITEAELVATARADANVARNLEGCTVIKTIVVPRKIVNFVIKP